MRIERVSIRYTCQSCERVTRRLDATAPFMCIGCEKILCRACKTSSYCKSCYQYLPEKVKTQLGKYQLIINLLRMLLLLVGLPSIIIMGDYMISLIGTSDPYINFRLKWLIVIGTIYFGYNYLKMKSLESNISWKNLSLVQSKRKN